MYKIISLIILFLSVELVYSGENNLSFNNFPDTIFINNETSIICEYQKIENETIIDWSWRIEFFACDSSSTLINEDGLSGEQQSQWLFNITNLATVSNRCREYFFYNDQYYNALKGYVLVFANDSNNESHSLIKEVLIVGEESDYDPCLCLEDFISFDFANEPIEQDESVSFTSLFIDDDGSGSSTEYWNWQLFSFYENGKYILNSVDSLFGLNKSIWEFDVDSLDNDFNFTRDSSGNVISFLVTNTINSDSGNYGIKRKIVIMQNVTSLEPFKHTSLSNFSLFQNYPNPFNPNTNIQFSLQRPENVYLSIYNSLGKKVKTLLDGDVLNGNKEIQWDGKDDHSKNVASGQYSYVLKIGSQVETKKMLLIR
ncbi:MAG: T9SS C-terminal target domain-containing protein [Calditrichaeota bacterium]|nr:MAG: T9SS C-terminal target domain-containing protein [Calditrichota bacterium]MBL1208121.1 T9SS C-terminal target domain-containing protein [Calditrichota bacterium]NOG47960.1 T9SS type A sorting domain-containing protein [Calditrichota bacterium]